MYRLLLCVAGNGLKQSTATLLKGPSTLIGKIDALGWCLGVFLVLQSAHVLTQ